MSDIDSNHAGPSEPTPEPQFAAGRSCAGCTMCCKVMTVHALAKPAQKWCVHCEVGSGCRVYASRPEECRTFFCNWLGDDGIADHWAPKRSRMVLVTYEANPYLINIRVDGDRADAWRKEPYRSDIGRWVEGAARHGGLVLVWTAKDVIALMPGREKNLGPLNDRQMVRTIKREGLNGVEWDAVVIEPGGPKLEELRT